MTKRATKAWFFLLCQKMLVTVLLLVLVFTDLAAWLHIPFAPEVKEAEAATGDFAIFRESAGTEVISTSGATFDATWDNTVESNSNITLQGNNSDIDLDEGGKYLVIYNSRLEQGATTSGTNRRSINSWLTLDGTELPYGRASNYLRDSDGTDMTYLSGGTIIDATAGQNLQLHMARDDINPTNPNSARSANTDGISVLKLKDSWDYLRLYNGATTSDVHLNTSFTDVAWQNADEIDTGSFGFTATSADITLIGNEGDHFLITANVTLYVDGITATRQNYEMQLTLDGNPIPGTMVTAYPRGNQSSEEIHFATLSYMGIITKASNSNETLNFEMRRESTGSQVTDIARYRTAATLVALPDTGSYIRLTDGSGTQTVSASAQDLTWDTQLEVDTLAFSHSTTSGSDVINIDAAGDYLFFATFRSTTTNGDNNRQPVTIEWKESGTVLNRGSFWGYNRNNGSNSAGGSGAVILPNLTTSSFVELEYSDESTSAPITSTIAADGISLQGILLDQNFYGTDVFVSATGTTEAETDITQIDYYNGGAYVITEQTSSRNVTSIRVTESGSVDARGGLDNVSLYYDIDETSPYNCGDHSFSGTSTESQFGGASEFSGSNGSVSFTGSVNISTTRTMCVYVVYDVNSTSTDRQTVDISIADPANDIGGSGSPTIGPATSVDITGSTTLRNAELTLTHYRWLNDDGSEGSASAIENEDTPAIGFANGTIRRLRLQVDAAGSTSSLPTAYQLDYATKTAACTAATTWVNVGDSGGAWDMSDSTFITNGTNATNIATTSGGLTDPANASFFSSNGGLRDTNSTTSALTFASSSFAEFEFAIEPTITAPQGNTYCFRLSNLGTELRNYDVYPEGSITADITVSASSSQVSSVNASSTNNYIGGTFVIERPGTARTLTDITITETGTVDGATNLNDIRIYYDLDTSSPFDCTGESFGGTESQFGATSSAFSSGNGTSSFTGSQSLNASQAFCGYVVLDVGAGALDGETIDIEISDPSSDVVVTSSSVGPSSAVSPTGSTTIAGPVLTQTHYHWRNDNGDETDTGATSATGGSEDTALDNVAKEATQRLRLQVSNEGSVTSQPAVYRLEYGTKITTCENVGTWSQVGVGSAFATSASAFISDGNTTDIDNTANGAMTEENTTFVGTGALRETTSESGTITLTSTEYTELEFSIEATDASGFDTTYCFRVTNAGTPLITYSQYPELTTREKQDFFVQRGVEIVSGTSSTLVAGVDYTAPAASTSAFVRITVSQLTGAGNNTTGNTQDADNVTAYIEYTTDVTNSFTIARPSTATDVTRVDWEIIEYVGLAGADNEMIVRTVDSVAYGSSATIATGTSLGNVTNDEDVVVFITGQTNENAGTGIYAAGQSTSLWHSTTSEPVFTRETTGAVSSVSYAVVEFTGLNWEIQRREHNYASSNSTEFEEISAVASLSTAFVHAQKRTGSVADNGLNDFGHQVWLSSVGQISFFLEAVGTGDATEHYSVAWVIENTQTGGGAMAVYRDSDEVDDNSNDVVPRVSTFNFNGTIDNLSNASIWITNDSSGDGTAFPRAMLGTRPTSSTEFEIFESNSGQFQEFRVAMVQWPVAELAFEQNYYRFYVDNDTATPTDPYPPGGSDLGENTSITGADDPLGENDRVHIRMTLNVNNASFPEDTVSFKLQYGTRDTTCTAISTWTDVGATGSAAIWRGYDASPDDGSELGSTLITSLPSVIRGTYEEANNSATNPNFADVDEDVEYAWLIEHNGATQLTDYCFRMVESDGTELAAYNNYPTLRTTGYTPIVGNWRWYDDATSTTPLNDMANENVAPIDVENQNEIKLRVTATEVEGAPGNNVKFLLQYSEYADFSDGGTALTATSTCTENSIWCYIDGGGVDNATITSAVLSDADSCVAGVGNGCGTHNEVATSSSVHVQPSLSSMEFEFALQHAGARANAVYYFRLYDVTNDVPVAASSTYPSLVTQGSQLVFTNTGLPSGTTTEGITTDVATASTSINFGNVPLDTEYEAAYRIAVNTNATEGYQVFMNVDQLMENDYGEPIPPIAGTNASPIAWTTGCSGLAGCFGYHAGDDSLFGGSARFAPDDTYAAISTSTLEEVAYSPIPANETHDIVYKISVGELQSAGEYTANLSFIVMPIY